MSLTKDKIEEHLKDNKQILENQAGFTKGGRIEDNLFLLNYCVEESYIKKKPLYVTAIDYSKAFDSVRRSELIETLKWYKVHPDVINAISSIYMKDFTQIRLNEETKGSIKVTSGIRQGCTGSTVLFKVVTYIIMKELMKTGLGFRSRQIYLPLLFFADDGLILTQSIVEMKKMLNKMTEISGKCGLAINTSKCAVLQFNDIKEDANGDIEGIKIVQEIKYLGVKICNERNLFKEHKKQVVKKAQRLTNMTYGIIKKCCNKILIGKAYWKTLALPSILYALNVTTINENEIQKLQKFENAVYRQILGAPPYAPNCTLRGEIGSSLMKTRIMEGHLQYIRRALQGGNDLIKEVIRIQLEENKTRWARITRKYLQELEVGATNLQRMSKEELKKRSRIWDQDMWEDELKQKSSLKVYQISKKEVKEERIYDNTAASVCLYQARTNTLKLNGRRFDTDDHICSLCGKEEEDMEHFILNCGKLGHVREQIEALQQPYIEEKEKIMGCFLFNMDMKTMEKNKDDLYKLWQTRKKILKLLQT